MLYCLNRVYWNALRSYVVNRVNINNALVTHGLLKSAMHHIKLAYRYALSYKHMSDMIEGKGINQRYVDLKNSHVIP